MKCVYDKSLVIKSLITSFPSVCKSLVHMGDIRLGTIGPKVCGQRLLINGLARLNSSEG